MNKSDEKSESKRLNLQVDLEYAGQRIDNFLFARLKGVPKGLIYRFLRKGNIRVNGKRVKQLYRVQQGDDISLPAITHSQSGAKSSTLNISKDFAEKLVSSVLYEDEAIVVINKPAGLAAHGGSGLNYGLIEALRYLWPKEKALELVHRLDRGTSGCVLLAKKRSVLKQLHEMVRENQINKHYQALVVGKWPKRLNRIDLPLKAERNAKGEQHQRVHKSGKPALTTAQIMRQFAEYTLLSLKIATGRMHQIRVHCAASGYPIIGDEKYGQVLANEAAQRLGLKRFFLHASKLDFIHPVTEQRLIVKAPLPRELVDFMDEITDE